VDSKIIWRTETGQRAWQSPKSGLPAGYRRILDLVAEPTEVTKVVVRLREYPPKQVEDWIDELETLCFVDASRIDKPFDARQAA
jgi:hypothetical protein